jgi:hypothetical protein
LIGLARPEGFTDRSCWDALRRGAIGADALLTQTRRAERSFGPLQTVYRTKGEGVKKNRRFTRINIEYSTYNKISKNSNHDFRVTDVYK